MTTSALVSREWYLSDADATRAAGRAIGEALLRIEQAAPLIITLRGDLGAGKTTLVSGLFNALGHKGAVRSPTYTLIEPYELADRQFYHLDLYRLTDPMQLEDLGFRDLLLRGAVLLIEWPERAGSILGPADLKVHLAYRAESTEGRQLTLQPGQESLQQLVDSLSF